MPSPWKKQGRPFGRKVWELANGAIQTNIFPTSQNQSQSKIIGKLLNTQAEEICLFTHL